MPWPRLAGVEHIGHQHRIIIRTGIDAALAENQPVEFEIVPHFQDAQIFEQRLEQFEGGLFGDLIIDDRSRKQTVASNRPLRGGSTGRSRPRWRRPPARSRRAPRASDRDCWSRYQPPRRPPRRRARSNPSTGRGCAPSRSAIGRRRSCAAPSAARRRAPPAWTRRHCFTVAAGAVGRLGGAFATQPRPAPQAGEVAKAFPVRPAGTATPRFRP